MKTINSEYELIEYLKQQDLKNNHVVLDIQGAYKKTVMCKPFYITGYLADNLTGSFPIGERFKVIIEWDTMEGVENSIKRVKEAIRL